MASGPADPALDGHARGKLRLVDRQLVIGEGARRPGVACLSAGLPGERLHSWLRLAGDSGEELVSTGVPEGAFVAEGNTRHGPHIGPRGRLVELEHLVEGALQQREVIFGETRAVGSGPEVGVDVAVNAVEGIGDGELAALDPDLIFVWLLLHSRCANCESMLLREDPVNGSRQSKLHGPSYLSSSSSNLRWCPGGLCSFILI